MIFLRNKLDVNKVFLLQWTIFSYLIVELEKAHPVKLQLHIMEEFLLLTKCVLDFFGIQYTMMVQKWWDMPKTRTFDAWSKHLAPHYTCSNWRDDSDLCRYLQLTWGWWVLFFSCMYRLLQLKWNHLKSITVFKS